MTNELIASTEFLAKLPDGEPFQVRVEIGRPYLSSEDPEEWKCPVSVQGLHPQLPDISGVDSLQSLCLAIRLAFDLLHAFRENGGLLMDSDGAESTNLEAYIHPFGAQPPK